MCQCAGVEEAAPTVEESLFEPLRASASGWAKTPVPWNISTRVEPSSLTSPIFAMISSAQIMRADCPEKETVLSPLRVYA